MPHRLVRFSWLTWRSALLCAPLLLLVWMGVWSFNSLLAHQERINSSDRLLALLSALIQVHSQLQEAESGQRGYLLTGKQSYLTPYWSASEKLEENIRRISPIASLVPHGTERLERLHALAKAKFSEMQKTIDLYRSGGLPAALAVVETDTGMRYMAQIRTEINEFVLDAYTLSGVQRDASVKAATRTTLLVTLGSSALFLLLVVATILIERDRHFQHRDALVIQDLNQTLEMKVINRTRALEEANRELEAFCYSVSHDLRAPLRSVDGFAKILARDYSDKPIDDHARDLMNRMSASTLRMSQLIDDLLNLSRIARGTLELVDFDLSALAAAVVRELEQQHPGRAVEVSIEQGIKVRGDPRLLRVAIENLLGNSWKFTRDAAYPQISFGRTRDGAAYFVRDNGVGFDMAHSKQLFMPFQRLHRDSEFEGTGIGLATVERVIRIHGGRIRAESRPGEGATFYFTIEAERGEILGESETDSISGGQPGRRAAGA